MVASTQTNKTQNTGNSLSQLLSTLIPVFLVAVIVTALFLILRPKFHRNYQPRSFLGALKPENRTPKISDSIFGWIPEFWRIPDTYVLTHHSMDGYLFLRFVKITVVCSLVGCLITWPILFPVNATGGGGQTQLDILTFSNVANYYRWYAHCGVGIIYFSFILYMITRESVFFINLRQAYLMSAFYAKRISSRTVLFTSVPEEYMEERKLRAMFGAGVRRIWFASKTDDLEDLVKERDNAAMKLEGAETKLIVSANQAKAKQEKKGGRTDSEEASIGENNIAMKYLKPKQRPTHKTKFLVGKKVDTIDWCRSELKRLVPEVEKAQAAHRNGDMEKLNSCFVEFSTLVEAQAAYQSVAHHQALHMSPRFAGITPNEVIWSNLRIKWWERVVRHIVALTLVTLLIVFWTIPVGAIGAISNIDKLENTTGFTWLSYIFDPMPSAIRGVITGLLPTILLAVLMALLPIILRLLAKFSGDPSLSAVELTVQNWYFAFQVVQVFLVATIGSAVASTAGQIAANPSSAINILATNLPKASNFYISYFVLQGLAVGSMLLAGLVPLAIFMILGKLLDKTPRKMYNRWTNLAGLGWGTVFPVYTNLFVIAICYSVIAPLVLGFATVGLFIFYVAFRYTLLFVSNTQIDTKGRCYPRALQHLFVGLYVAEACIIGLFAIGTGSSSGAIGPLIIMIFFLIFTALYHVSLNSALGPLLAYLPKSMDAEERRLLALEHGGDEENGYEKNVGNREGGAKSERKEIRELPAAHQKPSMFTKWLRPDKYCDYQTLRRLVPKDLEVHYSEEDEDIAYLNPAIAAETPLLWIPRDPLGISKQEVEATRHSIPITDEGAYLDEKNKVVWDAKDGRPPIYEEDPYY